MTERVLYWLSVVGGFIALLLFVGNTALIAGNRQLQEEVGRRQALLSNANNLSNLNQNLAQALAEIAVKEKDTAIRDLLAAQGITIRDPAKAGNDAETKKKK